MSAKRYLGLIHRLNCVTCLNCYGRVRLADEAHHLEFVRGEHSDYATCPLCHDCHEQMHQSRRRAFYLAHKLTDIKLLAWTAEQLDRLLYETGKRLAA